MSTRLRLGAATASAALLLAGCGGDAQPGALGDGTGQVDYWLWDANQLPAYQQCARDFEAANPDITVRITQLGWDDYWSRLTTSMVAGTAPDVFTDHLSRYSVYVNADQLLPLDDFIAEDGVDTDIYQPGLADLWVGQDGKRYGLPKDWDTIAIFYNKEMVAEAGLSEDDLAAMDWNPQDGGSYEDVIARLTVDENGVRGDEPGFDKDNVAVYGLGLEGNVGGGIGQTQWSMYTGANGWTATETNPWGEEYRYDEPAFHETIAWWRSLIEKGYMPPLEVASAGIGLPDAFAAGRAAMNTNGAWMIGQYYGYDGIDVGLAPTPIGPTGSRASMYNGLSDAIYAGSDNQRAAWEWVKYLGSPQCQETVGRAGVVFPAIPSATKIAEQAFAEKGVDTSAFTVHVEEGTTFLHPITDHAADIAAILEPEMEQVMGFGADPSSMAEANEQVNAFFSD